MKVEIEKEPEHKWERFIIECEKCNEILIIPKVNFNTIAEECVEIAKEHGFSPHQNIEDIEKHKWYLATKIAFIHSEATEMLEALRVNNLNNMVHEGIDVLIRTLEYLSCLKGVDIDKEIRKKMEINKKRSYMHGGKIL